MKPHTIIRFRCTKCNEIFHRLNLARNHIKNKHNRCDICKNIEPVEVDISGI